MYSFTFESESKENPGAKTKDPCVLSAFLLLLSANRFFTSTGTSSQGVFFQIRKSFCSSICPYTILRESLCASPVSTHPTPIQETSCILTIKDWCFFDGSCHYLFPFFSIDLQNYEFHRTQQKKWKKKHSRCDFFFFLFSFRLSFWGIAVGNILGGFLPCLRGSLDFFCLRSIGGWGDWRHDMPRSLGSLAP